MARNYRYVRFKTPQGVGYALFLLEWDRTKKEVEGVLEGKLSAAFCNPNDTFLKTRAREMVDVRLNENRQGRVMSFNVLATKTNIVSNEEFLRVLDLSMNHSTPAVAANPKSVYRDFAPNWARRAFVTGKVKLGLTVGKPKKAAH